MLFCTIHKRIILIKDFYFAQFCISTRGFSQGYNVTSLEIRSKNTFIVENDLRNITIILSKPDTWRDFIVFHDSSSILLFQFLRKNSGGLKVLYTLIIAAFLPLKNKRDKTILYLFTILLISH